MKQENLFAQVQQLHERGYSIRSIAGLTGISKSSVGRMVKEIQGLGPGTAAGTRPAPVPDRAGAPGGTVAAAVPKASRDIYGTLENDDFNTVVLKRLLEKQENPYIRNVLRSQYMVNLYESYQDLLSCMLYLLTEGFKKEELAHSQIKWMHQEVKHFMDCSIRVCSYCGASYRELFIAHVLEKISSFLEQQPEFESTVRGLKLSATADLELFIMKVQYLDICTPGIMRCYTLMI
ncbi:hypothetical protein [Pontibacter russatus]|uniref:hypothetical protein n=1 Tax=Pontibacter russatus TaxID=2694929 RepID=UPI00137961F2|nr:hypothetical protein [Pontibacter russatus]